MPGLRKDTWPDGYIATGPLDRIGGPGRRTVRRLELRRPRGDLSVLARFADLEQLVLVQVEGIDLSALACLRLRTLELDGAAELDLAPLQAIGGLGDLSLVGIASCAIPPVLSLPETLRSLTVINDAPDLDGAPVARLIDAIDFARLGELRSLIVRVGGLHAIAPIAVDLAFLGALGNLERLDLSQGVLHGGAAASPLEPPFPGLSRRLTRVGVTAADPEGMRAALATYLGRDAEVAVFEPSGATPRREWEIGEPIADGRWAAYGSLLRQEGARLGETEHDAAARAQRRLHAADPELAARIDFDPESAGTGISAATRADLSAALRLLGLG